MSAKKVFISYNHEDREVADKLKSALEKRGILVIIDRMDMRAGASIQEFIESSIRDADVTLSIVSNRSLLSAWVALESGAAFYGEKLRSDKKNIACYIDEDFFETDFRLKATEQIDAEIKDIDDKLQKYIERKLDTNDLNGQKSRLYKLRNDLGDILQKLKDSLTLDIRESEFDGSLARIIKSIEEIPSLPRTTDPTTVDPIPKSQPVFNVPFPRNKFFTGREEVLSRLYKNFNTSERTQALNGLGGIGKTQTAVEYAYRHRQDYEVVLWAGANTRETLVADYAAIAGLLDLSEKNAQDQGEAVAAVRRWLENKSNWLLILDNADEIEIVDEGIAQNPAFRSRNDFTHGSFSPK